MKALIILLFPVMLCAQQRWYEWTIEEHRADLHMEYVLDSVEVAVVPANAQVIAIFGIVDSAINDRVKIGLSGDDTSKPRFGWLDPDTLDAGTMVHFNPYFTWQNVTGSLYFYNAERAITCTNANQPYKITSWSTGMNNTMKLSGDSGYVVRAHENGQYQISGNVSFYANAAAEAHCEVFRNGDELPNLTFQRTIANATQAGSASFLSIVTLQEGDILKMTIEATAANKTFTIDHAQFTMRKLPDYIPYWTSTSKSVMLYAKTATGQIRLYVLYRLL